MNGQIKFENNDLRCFNESGKYLHRNFSKLLEYSISVRLWWMQVPVKFIMKLIFLIQKFPDFLYILADKSLKNVFSHVWRVIFFTRVVQISSWFDFFDPCTDSLCENWGNWWISAYEITDSAWNDGWGNRNTSNWLFKHVIGFFNLLTNCIEKFYILRAAVEFSFGIRSPYNGPTNIKSELPI